MGDLAPDFSLSEFVFSKTACDYAEKHSLLYEPPKITDFQHKMFIFLAKTLQTIRNNWDEKIHINNGLRDEICVKALIEKKYNVSSRTDHSFGDPEVYAWGVGAADFYMENVEPKKIMEFVYKTWKPILDKPEHFTRVGQAILYYKKYNFIHLGNPKELVYQPCFAKFLKSKKGQFLKTADGIHFEYYYS